MNDELIRVTTLPDYRDQIGRSIDARFRLYLVATTILMSFVAFCAPTSGHAQSKTTASRVGDLQIGAGFVFARSGYNFTPINLIGGTAYTTFDIRPHWGGEFDFHRAKATQDSTITETTFEAGPRVLIHRGRLVG